MKNDYGWMFVTFLIFCIGFLVGCVTEKFSMQGKLTKYGYARYHPITGEWQLNEKEEKPVVEMPQGSSIRKIHIPMPNGDISVGTGFFLSKEKFLISAGHVIEDHPKAIVSDRSDVGFIKIKQFQNSNLVPYNLQKIPSHVYVITHDREVKTRILGFAKMRDEGSGRPWIKHIRIEVIGDSDDWPGMSGSPVLMPDKKRVIGVLTGGYGDPVVATAVPIREVVMLMEK